MKYALLTVRGLNREFYSLPHNAQNFLKILNDWYGQENIWEFKHLQNRDIWMFDLESQTDQFCKIVTIAQATGMGYEVRYFMNEVTCFLSNLNST